MYYFNYFYRDVNNNIMELLIMAYACKTSSARSIVGVLPYLPYSKQCIIIYLSAFLVPLRLMQAHHFF